MAMVTVEMNLNQPIKLTKAQQQELLEASMRPIVIDEECPEITPELIGKRFIRVDRYRKANAV